MRTLNRAARDAVAMVGAHACTDVTGFSFLGHLYQMMRASGVSAQVQASQVPLLTGSLALARRGIGPGGTQRNKDYFGAHVTVASDVEEAVVSLLFDPQTSGGLLVSAAGDKKDALLASLTAQGVPAAYVGDVTVSSGGHVFVV